MPLEVKGTLTVHLILPYFLQLWQLFTHQLGCFGYSLNHAQSQSKGHNRGTDVLLVKSKNMGGWVGGWVHFVLVFLIFFFSSVFFPPENSLSSKFYRITYIGM